MLLYLGIYTSANNPPTVPNWDKREARLSEQVWRWAGLLWVLGFRQDELTVILSVLHIFCYFFNSLCLFPMTWTWIFSGQGNTGSLPDSCIHVPHTENNLARSDFLSQRPCWFFLYSLCLSMCSLISYFKIGSSILTRDERQAQSTSLEPCVWVGLTMAIFQAPDSVTPCNDRLHILASRSAISRLSSVTALGC